MANFSLKQADNAALKLTSIQQKQIRQLYQDAADNLGKEIQALENATTSSAAMNSLQLKNLQKELNVAMENIGTKTSFIVEDTMSKMAAYVAEDTKDWLLSNKIPSDMLKGAFYSLPSQVVKSISSGQVYSGNWTLSKAIWKDVQNNQGTLNNIVAIGLAQNRSTFDIAKDLEKYVNPSAAKGYEWSKMYPGSKKVVDYNAQRLARTMVSHAYTQSYKQTTKHNPFVEYTKWNTFSDDRVCALCRERANEDHIGKGPGIYKKGTEPLDHPNGRCYLTGVILKSPEQVAEEIANWINGEENQKLDTFAKDFDNGYVPAANSEKIVKKAKAGIPSNGKEVRGWDEEEYEDDEDYMPKEYSNLPVSKFGNAMSEAEYKALTAKEQQSIRNASKKVAFNNELNAKKYDSATYVHFKGTNVRWMDLTPAMQREFFEVQTKDLTNLISEKCKFSIKTIGDGLNGVLDSGKFRTIFSDDAMTAGIAGTKRGRTAGMSLKEIKDARASYKETRIFTEKYKFGFGSKYDVDKRPVYGSLSIDGMQQELSEYGDVEIILKKSAILGRSTFTLGDSMGTPSAPFFYGDTLRRGNFGVKLSSIYDSAGVVSEQIADASDVATRYIEFQVHGGLTVDSIESVVLPDSYKKDTKLLGKLTKQGISYIFKHGVIK